MKYGLSEKQLTEICDILASHPAVGEAVIYGSRVIDTYKEASDVDIAIKGAKTDDSLAAKLKHQLEEETHLPFFFDITAYNTIDNAELKKHIRTKGKTIYRKGWREVKLGDVVEIIGGGTPSTKQYKYWNGSVSWLTPRDLSHFSGRYITKGERNISELGLQNSNAKILPKGTVLLTTRAPIGYLAIAKNKVTINQGFKGLIANEHTQNLFLYYLLKQNIDYLKGHSSGTTFGELSGITLRSLSFCFPPLSEQKAIAEVLSSLDDKIDLLHRQNKTLEDMAQTLFRKWFIENANEEWEEKKLGDFFPIVTGKKDANYCTEDGEYPFFTCAQESLKAPGYSFEGVAILLAGNGDFNVKRYTGRFEAYQRTYVLIPYELKYFGFLYTLIKFHLLNITQGAQGSVVRFITKGMIDNFKFLMPIQNFDNKLKQINDFYVKIDFNSNQISTLKATRDILLSKLMNGKVRVN